MKAQHKYRPDFRTCVLEDRLVPVVPNLGLGTIVLTTSGYVLTSAFPGSAIPASFVMTGAAGVSGMQPGSGTGVPTSTTGSSGGATAMIFVGSGANDILGPVIPSVTRNTIANDALNPAPQIGRVLGGRSGALPPVEVHRDALAGTTAAGAATEASGQRYGPDPDEELVDPPPIRIRSRPHRLAAENNPAPG
jgi:hypothetical protein